jgi:2-polyprenyl-3-methyl-5-hydroxy-6-metoxy-1,4-benzoquinol methylase
VVVVDDCSTDHTRDLLQRLATSLPAENPKLKWVFRFHEKNQGKGGAIQTALNSVDGEITIVHDADLEYHPKDILRMVPIFLNEDADAVYGSRFAAHEYRRVLMFRHELGNRFLTFLSNLISNLNLTDMETCYKAVRTQLLKSIPLRSSDFRIEPELTIKLAKRHARVFEIPINYSGRTYQEGKKINWIDGLKALWAILRFGLSDDIYTEDRYGSKMLARLYGAHRFNGWLAETIQPFVGQNVLEIGAGGGRVMVKLIPRKTYIATDINPLHIHLMRHLKEDKPYLSVDYLDLKDISGFADKHQPFDTIICLDVIEHMDDDGQAMNNIAELLEKDGRAIVLVPHMQSFYGTLDKVLGHRRRYSKQALTQLAESTGLTVEKILTFNRASSIPWWLNGKLLRRKSFGFMQITTLNLITPLLKRVDRYLPLPALSLIAILSKQ